MKTKKLSDSVAKSMFLSLLPAQILAVIVLNINSFLNSLLIGNLMGSEFLAVFGFMVPVNCIHSMIGGGIASGAQILCGRCIGRGDQKGIRKIYAAVFFLCVCLGALLMFAYQVFSVQIASLLGASGNTLTYTADYLRGSGWSIIFMMLSSSMIPFLQMNNASGTMYASIAVMTAANAGFDLLAILVFRTGMFGIGLASSAAYLMFILVIVLYFLSDKCAIRFSLRDFNFASVKDIFHLGLPNITKPLFLAFRNLVFNNVAVRVGGTVAVTALALVGNMALIVDAFGTGIENSINIVASVFYGERDKESLREAAPIGIKIGMTIQYVLYAIVFLIARPFSRIFGAEPELVPAAATAIRLVMLYLIANIATNVILNIYKGIGKTAMINLFNLVNFILIPIPVCLLLSRLIGVNGVWLTYCLPEPLCLIGFLIYAARMRHQRPKKLADMVYIPESFGIGSKDRYDTVIKCVDDAADASRNAIAFCREKGLDERTGHFCGLCIEEMAVAVLEHGAENLKTESGKHEIDLRMIFEDGGMTILLRDNYPKFDILQWMKLHEPEDPIRYIGIRMAVSLAKEVNYSTALNLNVLTIRI